MWEIIQAAGWPIWPLILTSIIGVAIILERFWSLRKSQIIPDGLMANINLSKIKSSLVKKLEQELNINEQVLRFLTTSF